MHILSDALNSSLKYESYYPHFSHEKIEAYIGYKSFQRALDLGSGKDRSELKSPVLILEYVPGTKCPRHSTKAVS